MAFVEAAECERAEVDVPDTIVDFLQANILPGADDGDIDPVRMPADAAIGADARLQVVPLGAYCQVDRSIVTNAGTTVQREDRN